VLALSLSFLLFSPCFMKVDRIPGNAEIMTSAIAPSRNDGTEKNVSYLGDWLQMEPHQMPQKVRIATKKGYPFLSNSIA